MKDIKKLPVLKSVREVYSGVTRHYLDLLFSAPLAVAAYAAGVVIFSYVNGTASKSGMSQEEIGSAMLRAWQHHGLLLFIAVVLVSVAILASAVRWHRFVLLGERHRAGWGQYENGYAWCSLKIVFSILGLILSGAVLVSLAIVVSKSGGEIASEIKTLGYLALIIAYIGLFIVMTRLSLALPDVALGGRGKLGEAWNRTSGNSWNMLGYWVLVQAIVGIGASLIDMAITALIGSQFDTFTTNMVVAIITLPVSVYVLMIGVTMLSVAYREIVGFPQGGDTGEAEVHPV